MPLQLQNRWREDTHHYVRWSEDSRQVIRLYKPRLQQQLTLSPRCGHLKGNGRVKGAVRFTTLQLTVHPDKRYIGKTEKGFDFLGYRFRPQKLLEPAVQSPSRLLERARRLHEKGADSHRLRQYVQRWVSWLHGGLQGTVTENRINQIWDYVNLKLSG